MNLKFLSKIISFTISGIIVGSVPSVMAVELTGGQAMSLAASMEGYAFLIDSLRLNDLLNISEEELIWESSFSNAGSIFKSSGSIGGQQLNLNYTGVLSGVADIENLTWSGNWSGSFGSLTINANDKGSFLIGSDGSYTDLLFDQSSSASGVSLKVSGIEKLIGSITGTILGWLFGVPLLGSVGSEVASLISEIFVPEKPASGTENNKFIKFPARGSSGFKVAKQQTIFSDPPLEPIALLGSGDCVNNSSCFINGTLATAQPVPEPFTIIGTLIGGTAAFRMRKKLKAIAD